MDIQNSFFRTSIKALILDDKKRFLLSHEDNGFWDFPGGGMEFGESYEQTLVRELKEEMGLTVVEIGKYPQYFMSFANDNNVWMTNILYEVKVQDLNITPSSECTEVKFFDVESAKKENLFSNIKDFLTTFDPKRH